MPSVVGANDDNGGEHGENAGINAGRGFCVAAKHGIVISPNISGTNNLSENFDEKTTKSREMPVRS